MSDTVEKPPSDILEKIVRRKIQKIELELDRRQIVLVQVTHDS